MGLKLTCFFPSLKKKRVINDVTVDLTSANDAILVTLTFMLPLEFDSNLCRYNFPDRYASAGI